ncbi:ABC transporter substrate-binding protein [Candidimonas nitroreducens]|uniref:Iron ABC transporter substrate-binding protein n=1 Tax=Candidimonas nitroreducens TaxID=683354 RepID=A0A225LY91_9BURK|nr:ABC transporter substrate-binding protein [Candidimonas nitroreducens]OWT53986.1 iron ABC transporter substrate-binding protein [Candidimonas nitroreducens]
MRNLLFVCVVAAAFLAGDIDCQAANIQPGQVQELDRMSAKELVPLATKEGKVTVLTLTTRMPAVASAFEAAYPGIHVEVVDMNSNVQISRVAAEQKAHAYVTDVMYFASAASAQKDLLDPGYALRYVPPRIAAKLADKYTHPLLTHRLTARVVMYNEQAYPNGSPIHNLWELTTPKWKGKVVTIDPTLSDVPLDMFVTIALHPDEMAAAYQELFGKPIKIDSDLKGAGEQFIRDLYRNDMILLSNDETFYNSVGAKGLANPPVGLMNYSARRNNAKSNLALQIANDVKPATGYVFPSQLAITNHTPHPAAARLFVDFMMGDESPTGGPGFKPWNVPGDYSPLKTVVADPDAVPFDKLNVWLLDPAKVAADRKRIRDIMIAE